MRQRNEVAIKLGIISLSPPPPFSRRLLKTIEGGVVGFYFFAWVPNSQKEWDSNEEEKIRGPLLPP